MLASINSGNDLQNAARLIMHAVKIDDKELTTADVLNLDMQDFHSIMGKLI